MELTLCIGFMAIGGCGESVQRRQREVDDLKSSEEAITAVIEFLTAFVLFLIIVTAFLSLSGLMLGSNHPKSDQLDEYALQSVQKLTSDSGWFIPFDSNGDRDIANGTADWHLLNASTLLRGDLQPGLSGSYGRLDTSRLTALSNVTQDQFIRGLGLPDWSSVNLTVSVVESEDSGRIGTLLFQDGASRTSAGNSATTNRLMVADGETLQITFEVHDAGRTPTDLIITEFMVEPTVGFPEWVELYNPDGFATNLTGWGLGRTTEGGVHSLIGDGALAGGTVLLCSGKPSSQENSGAEVVLDLGISGVLGRGAVDGLRNYTDTIQLTWNAPGSSESQIISKVPWDQSWAIIGDQALDWNGGDTENSTSWDRLSGGTPGTI
jgi:hypothetical protein